MSYTDPSPQYVEQLRGIAEEYAPGWHLEVTKSIKRIGERTGAAYELALYRPGSSGVILLAHDEAPTPEKFTAWVQRCSEVAALSDAPDPCQMLNPDLFTDIRSKASTLGWGRVTVHWIVGLCQRHGLLSEAEADWLRGYADREIEHATDVSAR